jgi:uracil-DNA glycosylase
MFFEALHPIWQHLLSDQKALLEEIEGKLLAIEDEVTPALENIMRAFSKNPKEIKVLIIGQDPYPTEGVAVGLAFAVSEGTAMPGSLRNLMLELKNDINMGVAASGKIESWVEQGVFLLNTSLTTAVGTPNAHEKLGWDRFTGATIAVLDRYLEGKLVCLSLGANAKKLSREVRQGIVIEATHPSPLSAHRGFFGSKVFSRVNLALQKLEIEPIDWSC